MKIITYKLNAVEKETYLKNYFTEHRYNYIYDAPLLPTLFSENENEYIANINNATFEDLYPIYEKLKGALPDEGVHLSNKEGKIITKPIYASIQPCSILYDLYLAQTFSGNKEIIDSNGSVLTYLHESNETDDEKMKIAEEGLDWSDVDSQIGENEHGFLVKTNEYLFERKWGNDEISYQIKQFSRLSPTATKDQDAAGFQTACFIKDLTDFTLNEATFPDVLSNRAEIDLIKKIRENPFLFKDLAIAILTKENAAYEGLFIRKGYYDVGKNWFIDVDRLWSGSYSSDYILDSLSIYPYLPFSLKIDLDVLLALFIRCMHTSQLKEAGVAPPKSLSELKIRLDQGDKILYQARHYFPIKLDESFIEDDFSKRNISELVPFIIKNLSRARELFFLFPEIIFFAPEEIKNNIDIALEAVQQNGLALRHLPEKLRNNKKIVLAAVIQNAKSLLYISDKLKNNKEIHILAISQIPDFLKHVSTEMANYKKIVLSATKQNGLTLEFASDNLKADRGVVLSAIKQNGLALEFTSDNLKADRSIVLSAIKQNGRALKFASELLQADRKLVMLAINCDGYALAYASSIFKADKKIVLAAIKKDGNIFEFTSEQLKNDRQVALAAINRSYPDFTYVSDELQNDKNFVLAAIKKNWRTYEYVPRELKTNRQILITYIKSGGRLLPRLSSILGNNIQAMLLFVKKNGLNLQFASESLKDNKKIVLEAIKQNGRALYYASDACKNNKQVVFKAVQQNGLALESASEVLKNNEHLVLAAVMQNGMALEYASENLRGNKKIVLAAIKETAAPLAFATENIKQDHEIIEAVLTLSNTKTGNDLSEEDELDLPF